MATVPSSNNGLSRKVNFQEATSRQRNLSEPDSTPDNATHPSPFPPYSNPTASKSAYDMNDLLRSGGPEPQDPQQLDDARKGTKLLKRQKSTSGRGLRRFFGGFRSKKSTPDLRSQATEDKAFHGGKRSSITIAKSFLTDLLTLKGAKYTELKPKLGEVETDKSNYNDSAWTTALPTARASVDFDDEYDGEMQPQRTLEAHAQDSSALRSSSSRFSVGLSNDHMHEMIGELQGDQCASPLNPAFVRHSDKAFNAKGPNSAPSNDSIKAKGSQPQQSSLRQPQSNGDMMRQATTPHSKMTLNPELKALRDTPRTDTPDLDVVSGATDPRVALKSHPYDGYNSQTPTRPLPSVPQYQYHSAGTRDPMAAVSAYATFHPELWRQHNTAPPPIVTQQPSAAQAPKAGRLGEASPSSAKAGFYYSGSETDSNSTDRLSSKAKGRKTNVNPDQDPSVAAMINNGTSFTDAPRQATQTERATERASKVRERKLRDRKASVGSTPPLSSARGSLEEMTDRPSSSGTRYPKDAAAKKTSPITREAPPMPAVPATGLFSGQASRAVSVHSTADSASSLAQDGQRQLQRAAAGHSAPPTRAAPAPIRAISSPAPRNGSGSELSASGVMTVAATLSEESGPRSPIILAARPPPSPGRGSNRSSDVELRARVAELEHQNALLQAALSAVLATNGRLNGCPCQGTGMASPSGDALALYRATRDASRLSVHSGAGGA